MRGIINGKLVTPYGIEENKVLVFEEHILDIVEEKEMRKYGHIEYIDADGKYVSPGFIDLHIHGAGGKDTMEGSREALTHISNTLVRSGVTGFLPTTMTMDKETIYRALDQIRDARDIPIQGAAVLGAHLEGPFISRVYKGAQDEKYILKPSYEFIQEYLDIIRMITLAPEEDENLSFIKKMKDHKEVILSLGHSNATFEEAMEAFQHGLCHVTHTFNAMTPFHHRNPGAVGAVFRSNVTCELIADKIHVHPGIFELLIKVMGKDNVILVTDAMCAAFMKEGDYTLGGQLVKVEGEAARLQDGTLAGSTLTLNKAIRNMKENTTLKLHEIIQMVSLNPAKRVGLGHKKGQLEVGYDADITLLDESMNIHGTIVKGEVVYMNMGE